MLYITHKPTNTLRTTLIEHKESPDKLEQSAVIYKIDDMNSQTNDAAETWKKVGTILHEHRCAINRYDEKSQV